jgi:hypothetical protein
MRSRTAAIPASRSMSASAWPADFQLEIALAVEMRSPLPGFPAGRRRAACRRSPPASASPEDRPYAARRWNPPARSPARKPSRSNPRKSGVKRVGQYPTHCLRTKSLAGSLLDARQRVDDGTLHHGQPERRHEPVEVFPAAFHPMLRIRRGRQPERRVAPEIRSSAAAPKPAARRSCLKLSSLVRSGDLSNHFGTREFRGDALAFPAVLPSRMRARTNNCGASRKRDDCRSETAGAA